MRLAIRGHYAPDWPAIARDVKDAAGWRCVRCAAPHGPPPRVLTVHHLDGDKGNNRWWNLLALCQRCHLTIQAKVIPERPYLWEHSPWFKVYAAGFYAWHHGKHTPTRAAVEADLDRWLALGQPWLYPNSETPDARADRPTDALENP